MSAQVDHAEIKLGQIFTIVMAAAAFVLSDPKWLIALGAIFLVTAAFRPLSPFVMVYRYAVRPLGIMHSDYRLDNIQPHSFGQLIGALTVAVALALLYAGFDAAGWAVISVLASLTLASYLGWCIGCFMYYRINRWGLRGFFGHSPTDRLAALGRRPGKTPASTDAPRE